MMTALLIAFLAPAAVGAQTTAGDGDVHRVPETRCMERHLREAAALNKERMPRYSALTDGRSRGVSRRLIWTERLALSAAWYVDWRAREFQRVGIPIVCHDFEPMANTPAFRDRADHPPPLSAFAPSDARGIRRSIRRAYRAGGFAAVSDTIEGQIERLSAVPAFHCMTRHLLESALRISNQAPLYIAQARRLGVKSPAGLSRTMLNLHLTGLPEAAALDRRAAPLQAEGLPIICQDVPPIPPFANADP